jgi:AAA ATPase domain
MDPRDNPYAPGTGSPPPELAGRDEIIERASVALDRIRAKRAARSLILYGLRGVGKTVVLNKISLDAKARGFVTVPNEAPEERSLPSLLAPALRAALIRLNRGEALRSAALRSVKVLSSFVNALKVKFDDIELSTEFGTEKGIADSGDLELDLSDLLTQISHAAAKRQTAVLRGTIVRIHSNRSPRRTGCSRCAL